VTAAEQYLARALRRWVTAVDRRARAVVAGVAAITVAAAGVAGMGLGLDADNRRLLDEDLPFQEREREFARTFPTLTESLLVVLDSESGEAVRSAAQDLVGELEKHPDSFRRVWSPGTDGFFERHGLLYRSADELEEFGDRLARLQPILAELTTDPTLPAFCRVIRMGLDHTRAEGSADEELTGVLDEFSRATVSVYVERPVSVSWENVFLQGSSLDPTTRLVVIADTVLDFDAILQAAAPIELIRDAGRSLGLEERGVQLRITGYPALNHEEMLGLVWDVGIAGLLSFILVLVILWLALRSKRLAGAAAGTLVVGLVWTAAFAALAVGKLNLVSLAFSVLVIGLGVDFSIHLCLHYAALRRTDLPHQEALLETVGLVGPALALCAATTTIGFFAFVPTHYRGVAELGLISGTGMVLLLFLTLTFLPALLRLMCEQVPLPETRLPARLEASAAMSVERRSGIVLLTALVCAVVAAALAPRTHFDSNVVEMRDPDTESVQTFHDLLEDTATSPWYVDVVTPDLDTAATRARELAALPEVASTASLLDYVPADQDEKLLILEDAAYLLDVPSRSAVAPEPSPAEQLAALRELAETLDVEWVDAAKTPLARSARLLRSRLQQTLAKLDGDPTRSEALAELEQGLLSQLPERVERLRSALETGPVTLDDLPENLTARMLAADGRARVQVFPTEDLRDDRALAAFVAAVREQESEISGLPVNLIDSGTATATSLREAVSWALAAITILLVVLWRRPLEALLVLGPLFLAGLFTVGVMAATGLSFNFINVIALPLLLGIGVDSGIHLVTRARRPLTGGERLVDTVTARGVLWSALTTLVSFSTLALSGHRGLASLGLLLALGMATTLISMLGVLPALLARVGSRLRGPAAR
jgi:hopanoid biosynthesis associated RND transporter like protein HpnN